MIPRYEPKVKLVSYTRPVNLESVETPSELLAFIARVSNPSNQLNSDTSERLMKYLVNHKHWSPFQMVDATIEFTIPRDITRQMLRHRSFDVQEFSQRYADPTNSLGFALREGRLQDTTNRQNSLPCLDEELTQWWYRKQEDVLATVSLAYNEAIAKGIAKECARVLLPEGLTLSKLYFKGSIRSWIHYLDVRCDEATQKEHRDIANGSMSILKELIPSVFTTVLQSISK